MNGIDQGQTILMALLIIVPVLGLSYRHQIKLNLKLIEANARIDRALEILRDPYWEDEMSGDVHDALIGLDGGRMDIQKYVAEYIAENIDATLDGAVVHVCNELHCRYEPVRAEWIRVMGDGEDIDWRHPR